MRLGALRQVMDLHRCQETPMVGTFGLTHVALRTSLSPANPYLFARDRDGYLVEIWYERPTPIDPN